MLNGFDPARLARLAEPTRALVERRARLLGPAYRLFYDDPVEIVRGRGCTLYDRDGNAYLDAYNNVVPLGHAHPGVVAAVANQLGTLSTHTRYLQEGLLRYAEALIGTLGGRIGHVMFTCTGSEANDLALRIAKHRTTARGVIVTSNAYHGTSELTAGLSPSLGEGSPLGASVRRVPAPDRYRVAVGDLPAWFAAAVEAQVADLRRHGEGLAALIVDPVFSSDGIFTHPVPVLGLAADVVRRAGGLVIADEVQSGFGRTGETFWGFQRHGVEPDIVTMGKPMGNGYPVAAVALAPETVAAFGADIRYFNTFGGNSVAVAAAQATLDAIQDEGLQASAARVGALLREGLSALARRHPVLGDVRGAGLYTGVEMVEDRGTKAPAPALAHAAVNGLRARGVLISATGPHGNVLKIRPPLVFGADDVARLLTALDGTLQELSAT